MIKWKVISTREFTFNATFNTKKEALACIEHYRTRYGDSMAKILKIEKITTQGLPRRIKHYRVIKL